MELKIFVSSNKKSKIENKKCEENEKKSKGVWAKIVCCTCGEMWKVREQLVKCAAAFEIRCICTVLFL